MSEPSSSAIELSTYTEAVSATKNQFLYYIAMTPINIPTSRVTPHGLQMFFTTSLIDRNNNDFEIRAWGNDAEQFYDVIKKIKTYPAILRFRSIIVKTFDASGAFKPRTFIKHSYMIVTSSTKIAIEKEGIFAPRLIPKSKRNINAVRKLYRYQNHINTECVKSGNVTFIEKQLLN